MKNISLATTTVLLVLFGMVVYFSACRPDACATRAVECLNNSICRDGDCICSSGYEGDSCQFKVNKKFVSNYACIRTRLINNTIQDDNDDTLRIIANGDNKFGITIYSIRDSIVERINATVNNNNLNIPDQVITFPGIPDPIYNYRGTGSLTNGILSITLYTNNPPKGYSAKTTYVGYKYSE